MYKKTKLSIDEKRIFLYQLSEYSNNLPSDVADKFLNEYSDEHIEKICNKIHLNEFIGSLVFLAIYLIRKAIKKKKDFIHKQINNCSHLIGADKKKCINLARRRGLEIEINELKKNIGDCRKDKDPSKCKNVITNRIKKLKSKIRI
jgi:hypothetical protein